MIHPRASYLVSCVTLGRVLPEASDSEAHARVDEGTQGVYSSLLHIEKEAGGIFSQGAAAA